MKANKATAEVFYTAFKALENAEKDAFLTRVVSDDEVREDLIDLALIVEAKKVKGKAIPARIYFEKRKRKRVA